MTVNTISHIHTTDEHQVELDLAGAQLSATQEKALAMAIRLLGSLPVEFAIVLNGDIYSKKGNSLGLISMPKDPVRRRSKSLYPIGSLVRYLRPILDPMKVGDVAQIKVGDFDLHAIRRSTTAYASKIWGLKSYTSMQTTLPSGEVCYEILRTA